uniref:Uncharacterized protein n=1 Tax=Vespula pensylvanica TaxID=30213 RepID=A0A834NXD0_VESPE|nr:hypothetical protein H0235_010496 [Vespula pensylvanica]
MVATAFGKRKEEPTARFDAVPGNCIGGVKKGVALAFFEPPIETNEEEEGRGWSRTDNRIRIAGRAADGELDICRAFELSSILNASHSEDGGLIVDFFAYTFADENMNVADPMQSSCVKSQSDGS